VLRVLELWLGWWRDVLLARLGCEHLAVSQDGMVEIRRSAQALSVEQIYATLESLQASARHLAENVNARLTFEVLLLDLPSV
jgi:hypothetical protein